MTLNGERGVCGRIDGCKCHLSLRALLKKLGHDGACEEALAWVGDRDLPTAWRECKRADWMLWLCKHMAGAAGWPTHSEVLLARAAMAAEPAVAAAKAAGAAAVAAGAASWPAELTAMADLIRTMLQVPDRRCIENEMEENT